MQKIWRSALALLALLSSVVFLSAQDETQTIAVVGSGIVNPVLESVITASATELEFDMTTAGTAAAVEQFCTGTVDIATASRIISTEESTACRDSAIEYSELLIGYDILAVIINPVDAFATCLTTEQLNTLFAPSATGVTLNWNQLNDATATTDNLGTFPELALQVLVPEDTTLTYAELDNIVSGVGYRADATTANFETILETVGTTPGAIGAVPLQLALATPNVLTAGIQFPASDSGCLPPSIEVAEGGLYPAVTPLFVYVNRASQEKLGDFLTFLASESSAESVAASGFTPASLTTYETNLAIIAGAEESRSSSENEATFTIPPAVTGAVNVGGSSIGFSLADTAATSLTSTQTNLTINRDFSGEALGITAFCSSELAVLFVKGDGTITCEGETPEMVTVPLGYQAVILVANAADEYTTCLTTEQIQTIWSAATTDTIETWNNVAESMPDQPITLFAARDGSDVLTDIMLTPAGGGAVLPVRADTETNFDPLYRAAAVANVPGSLTYMKWSDYESVLENGQQRIQLVLVDGGNGCVQPSVETINSGEYPLAMETTVVLNKILLGDIAVQSYVWTMFSDTSLSFFDSSGFVGIDENRLADIRVRLVTEFTDASLAAAAAQPEVTPEATAEAESTETANEVEATAEVATEEPTTPETEATEEIATEESGD